MRHEDEESGNWLLTVIIMAVCALASLWLYHHADKERKKVDVLRADIASQGRQVLANLGNEQ